MCHSNWARQFVSSASHWLIITRCGPTRTQIFYTDGKRAKYGTQNQNIEKYVVWLWLRRVWRVILQAWMKTPEKEQTYHYPLTERSRRMTITYYYEFWIQRRPKKFDLHWQVWSEFFRWDNRKFLIETFSPPNACWHRTTDEEKKHLSLRSVYCMCVCGCAHTQIHDYAQSPVQRYRIINTTRYVFYKKEILRWGSSSARLSLQWAFPSAHKINNQSACSDRCTSCAPVHALARLEPVLRIALYRNRFSSWISVDTIGIEKSRGNLGNEAN